jgi:tetratricopeptide (TPR) repeat protein
LIIILGICIFIPLITAYAEDDEIPAGESPAIESDLLDFSELSQYRDEQGLKNLEPHSLALLERGLRAYDEGRDEEAIVFFNGAKQLSPDLPLSYLYLAKAYFSLSKTGLYSTSSFFNDAWNAFWKNFWWSFQASGMVALTLLFAFYISFIVLLTALVASKFNLYLHDVMEDKKKFLLLLPPVILLFFGPIFGIVGVILPFWIYMKSRERVVIYCCLAIFVFIIIMLPVFSSFLGASQDKSFRDIVRINNGIYTGEITEPIREGGSYEAFFAYAIDNKRKGNYDKSIKIYNELLNQREDVKIYNNLANCYIGLGDYNTALSYYNKALKLKEMASIYYNISQLYREIFNFDQAEKYYEKALNVNPYKVKYYDSLKGSSVNSLVIDETLTSKTLWDLAFKRYQYYKTSELLGKMFTFANRGIAVVLLLLLIFALYMYNKLSSYGAYRCRRCGEIYCGDCEKRISQEDICITCFKTLIKVSELGSRDRIERILEIQRYREDRNQHLKILTLIFPGCGHIYYGWTVFGFLISLLFAFFLSSTFFWFYIPTPAAMNPVADFIKWISVACVVIVYGFAMEKVFRRAPRRWL